MRDYGDPFLSLLYYYIRNRQNHKFMILDKKTAIQIATSKAQELGYDVQEMSVSCSWSGLDFTVEFLPKDLIQTGGDLKIVIDGRTGKIKDIQRGQ